MSPVLLKILAFIVIFGEVQRHVEAYNHNRVKRSVSESRMNNLETLVALNKMKKSSLPDPDDMENRYRYETVKRVSAPVISDLQTKIALKNNIKGLAITMPIAGGKLDPWMIGRKRRSDSRFLDTFFNHQYEDETPGAFQQDYEDSLFSYNLIH